MTVLHRAFHNLRGRHDWQITLPEGASAARLVCDCGKAEPLTPPASPVKRCFCRDVNCAGWRTYVAHHANTYGRMPTNKDIRIDEALAEGWDKFVEQISVGGPPSSVRDLFDKAQKWIEEAE